MSFSPAPSPRASLLAALRTGGVRSSSSPLANLPHTAAPSAPSFNLPRSVSQDIHFDTQPQNFDRPVPVTAAVDGPSNSFATQQKGMNPHSTPFSPAFPHNIHSQNVHAQALQLQAMQLELIRLQTLQAHQYQAELIAHAQLQQQNRRPSPSFIPPASAGPSTPAFDLRAATVSAQMRRANQLDSLKSQSPVDQVPMTAALGGKFGSRSARFGPNDTEDIPPLPFTPGAATTVISGGTSLGTIPPSSNPPSKSDSALSWRRGGNNNSVLSGNNRNITPNSPTVKVTPPPPDRLSPPPPPPRNSPPLPVHAPKTRPLPLRFSPAASQPLPVLAVDGSPTDSSDMINSSRADDGYSSSSSKSLSSPATPPSASSADLPLSPREEASKKLYEGLGIGRPTAALKVVIDSSHPAPSSSLVSATHRVASQPMRQPRGPPSGMDELGPHNFATRLRRKAVGGLGAALIGARERREFVEAY